MRFAVKVLMAPKFVLGAEHTFSRRPSTLMPSPSASPAAWTPGADFPPLDRSRVKGRGRARRERERQAAARDFAFWSSMDDIDDAQHLSPTTPELHSQRDGTSYLQLRISELEEELLAAADLLAETTTEKERVAAAKLEAVAAAEDAIEKAEAQIEAARAEAAAKA